MIESSIWSTDRIQTCTTNLGQSRAESYGIDRVLHIPQSSKDRDLSIKWNLKS